MSMMPASGRRMHRVLQFRLGSHALPFAIGRYVGSQHVDRADRFCPHCVPGSIADDHELQLDFECPALQLIRQRYAAIFAPETASMRSSLLDKGIMCRFSSLFSTEKK